MPQELHQKCSIYGWRLVVNLDDFSSRYPVPQVVNTYDVRVFYEDKAKEAGIPQGINILMLKYDKATLRNTFAKSAR